MGKRKRELRKSRDVVTLSPGEKREADSDVRALNHSPRDSLILFAKKETVLLRSG